MLKSIGKESGESVESFRKKKINKKNKFAVSFTTIFGTVSFHTGRHRSAMIFGHAKDRCVSPE